MTNNWWISEFNILEELIVEVFQPLVKDSKWFDIHRHMSMNGKRVVNLYLTLLIYILGVKIKGCLSLFEFLYVFDSDWIRTTHQFSIKFKILFQFSYISFSRKNFNGLVSLYSCGKCWNFHYIDCKNQNEHDVFLIYRYTVWANKTYFMYDIGAMTCVLYKEI